MPTFRLLAEPGCLATDAFCTATITPKQDGNFEQLLRDVASALKVVLWKTVSLHPLVEDAGRQEAGPQLDSIEQVQQQKAEIAVLVSGKKIHNVPGPTGGLPFLGSYSEIYPDFIGNQQRLLDKYGHMVRIEYMKKQVYYADDPDCAQAVLSEGEYYSKFLNTDHPLFALHEGLPDGLFTANTSNPAWATAHKFVQTALGAKAMRNYGSVMDSSAKKLVNIFSHFEKNHTHIDVFPWTLRAAGSTICEVTLGEGQDLGMLDSPDAPLAEVLIQIGQALHASQALYAKGKLYRLLPGTHERKLQKEAGVYQYKFLQDQVKRTLDLHTPDKPMKEAALESKSLLDYLLHAVDEGGDKLDLQLAMSNAATLLGAGQVTTSSLLAWIIYCLSEHPDEAKKLHIALLQAGFRKDSEMTPDQLNKVDRLVNFVRETQRLYNPAFQPTRCAMQDSIAPGGYFVPKDSQITVALHSIMINKEHWRNATVFDVDRWDTPEVQKRHPQAFLPFATGGRSCIGFAFALQEVNYIVARLVLNFRFENVTGEPVVYDPGFSLYRPLNLKVKALPQEDADKVLQEAKREPQKQSQQSAPKEAKNAKAAAVGRPDLPVLYALHASNSGTAKGYASELVTKARSLGFRTEFMTLNELAIANEEEMAKLASGHNLLLVVAATYNGEPSDSALDFDIALDAALKAGEEAKDCLHGLSFSVFGCGNTQWGATYQAFPNKVDESLKNLGAERFHPKGTGNSDDDQDRDFHEWAQTLWGTVAAQHGIDLNNPSAGGNAETAPSGPPIKVHFEPYRRGTEAEPVRAPLEGLQQSEIVSNIELVDKDTPLPRGMRLITLTLPKGQTYRAGDHVEIVPENSDEAVEAVLASLNLVEQGLFSVKVEDEASLNANSLGAKLAEVGTVTVKEALRYWADLSAPVARGALQLIASRLDEGDETRKELEAIADPGADKEAAAEFNRKNRNFATFLQHYPSIAQVMGLPELLLAVKAISTRRYSIASSPVADEKTLKICVGVDVVLRGSNEPFEGLCSGYLKRRQPGQRVWLKVRPAPEAFHLPEDHLVPITMVAAGTGIAPFLGFFEERKARDHKLRESGGKAEKFKLYYGTTHHDMKILREIIADHQAQGYSVTEAAYSADQSARKYAQQLLLKNAVEVWTDIAAGGRVYVCGSGKTVGKGVEDSLKSIAQQVGGVEDPKAWLADLIKQGRFAEDVFG